MAQQELNEAISLEKEDTEEENGNTTTEVCCEQWISKVTNQRDNTKRKSLSEEQKQVWKQGDVTEIQQLFCISSLTKSLNSSSAPYLISVLDPFTLLPNPSHFHFLSLTLSILSVSLTPFYIPSHTWFPCHSHSTASHPFFHLASWFLVPIFFPNLSQCPRPSGLGLPLHPCWIMFFQYLSSGLPHFAQIVEISPSHQTQCVSQFHPPISVPVSSPGSQSKPLTSESKSPTAPRCAPSFLLFFSLILKPRLFQSLSVQVFKDKSKKTLQGLIKEVRDKYLAALTVLLVAETDLLTQMSKVTLPLNFRGIGL